MSKLGYVTSSAGKKIDLAVANTYSINILNGSNLPANSLIISSPIDSKNNDLGIFSMAATDSNSVPVRISYCIQEGNGLHFKDDSLFLDIDKNTIIEKDSTIRLNIDGIIDNKTIINSDKGLKVDINYLDKASKDNFGVFSVDGKTLSINGDTLSVNTSKLEYGDKLTNQYGIVIGDGKTVLSDQGVLKIIQENLSKASSESFGMINSNNQAINIEDGILSIDTELLRKGNDSIYGIVKPDNKTIVLNSNNELTLNDSLLDKASSKNYGIFKIDPNIFEINNDTLSILNYDKTQDKIKEIEEKCNKVKEKLENVNYLLNEYSGRISGSMIKKFYCSQLISRILIKPKKQDEKVNDMPTQYVNAQFIINTNCPFIISVIYEDNIDPQISLFEINYNNINTFKGNIGLGQIYQTTEEIDAHLTLTFACKNYNLSDTSNYSKSTKIKITVSAFNDTSVYKSINYAITRFNSMYREEIEYKDMNIDFYTNTDED